MPPAAAAFGLEQRPQLQLFGGAAAGREDAEYHQTGSLVVDGGDHFSVSAVAFDPQQELLWMGNMGVSGGC